MNRALISLGSNYNSDNNISLCCIRLSDMFDNIRFSEQSITTPYGHSYKNDFLNQLALVFTDKTQEEVSLSLKELEKKLGRNSLDKEVGLVKIDIDLVQWNDSVIKPEDMKRDYVSMLLSSIESQNSADTL